MMYEQNESETQEWILDGAPKRLRKSEEYQEEKNKALINMPAYKNWLTDIEVDDQITYVKAVSWFSFPPSKLAMRDQGIAHEKGCFGCPIQDHLKGIYQAGMEKILRNLSKMIAN